MGALISDPHGFYTICQIRLPNSAHCVPVPPRFQVEALRHLCLARLGEHSLDFAYVGYVVPVNLRFLQNPGRSGIFNLGTGRAQPFNDLAVAAINSLSAARAEPPLSLMALPEAGMVEFIDFPDSLTVEYQSHTQAYFTLLRPAGSSNKFASVADGLGQYASWLLEAV
jgi:ADP-L-glycero-D-manno-heptose 6-epimerase